MSIIKSGQVEAQLDEASHSSIGDLEKTLKSIWSEYMAHQEKYGLNERTKNLKEKYFNLYQSYRRNKVWNQVISDGQ